MDIVKASLLSLCLRPVTFMEEKEGFGFVFAIQSRFEVGQNYGNPKFFSKFPFKEMSTAIFIRGVRSSGTYML